jgi:hypothetical protein
MSSRPSKEVVDTGKGKNETSRSRRHAERHLIERARDRRANRFDEAAAA